MLPVVALFKYDIQQHIHCMFLFVWQSNVNILFSWCRWGLHHMGAMPLNRAKCLYCTNNRHLTTSLTVINSTTTFLTLVYHLNRVQLYDRVWICVLLLCCQWAWFPFLSTHMRRGPLHCVVWDSKAVTTLSHASLVEASDSSFTHYTASPKNAPVTTLSKQSRIDQIDEM